MRGRVLLKREDVQHGFSFHMRGALNLLLVDFIAPTLSFCSRRARIATRADLKRKNVCRYMHIQRERETETAAACRVIRTSIRAS
jgi:threonine dehydratase